MNKVEKEHLLRAWILVSLCFAILFRSNFLVAFIVSLFTVGLGFVLHEMAHKYFAQKFKCHAEFRANDQMLLVALVLAYFGFIFIAPGAVIIRGYLSKEQNGIISLAGPFTNLLLALFFLVINLFLPNPVSYYGAFTNSLLGFFNLLPFPMFDGIKVFYWNKKVYFTSFVLAGLLFILVY